MLNTDCKISHNAEVTTFRAIHLLGRYVYVFAAEATTLPATATVTWTKSATHALLHVVKDKQSELKDKITKTKTVWKEVALLLQVELPGVTPDQCSQKWRNLQQQFKKYVDNSNKTGRGRMTKPEFFDEIGEIMGNSHTVKPQYVFDTESVCATPAATDSETSLIEKTETVSLNKPKNKKMKPATTKEKLESKLDLLIAEHAADREQNQKQFKLMMLMIQKQHDDRQKMMKLMVKACSRKRRAKDSDSDSD